MPNNDNENQPIIKKTWLMIKRAIPPIIPTQPVHSSGLRYAYEFDAQWNTANGHNSKTTEWEYLPGNNTGYNMRNLIITNGQWIDKNYLEFDGTGYMAPAVQREFLPANGSGIYVVNGIGTIYYGVNDGYERSLKITEDEVIFTHAQGGKYQNVIKVPGKDVRMIYCQYKQLVVYDKYGNRYKTVRNSGQDSYVYCDSVQYCNGFVGKIYSIKQFLSYYDNYTELDKEWEYAKNRFKLD